MQNSIIHKLCCSGWVLCCGHVENNGADPCPRCYMLGGSLAGRQPAFISRKPSLCAQSSNYCTSWAIARDNPVFELSFAWFRYEQTEGGARHCLRVERDETRRSQSLKRLGLNVRWCVKIMSRSLIAAHRHRVMWWTRETHGGISELEKIYKLDFPFFCCVCVDGMRPSSGMAELQMTDRHGKPWIRLKQNRYVGNGPQIIDWNEEINSLETLRQTSGNTGFLSNEAHALDCGEYTTRAVANIKKEIREAY